MSEVIIPSSVDFEVSGVSSRRRPQQVALVAVVVVNIAVLSTAGYPCCVDGGSVEDLFEELRIVSRVCL